MCTVDIFLVSQAKLFFISIDDDIVDKTFKVEKNFDALSRTFCIFDFFFLIQNFVIGRQTAWCFWFFFTYLVGQTVNGQIVWVRLYNNQAAGRALSM